VTASTKARPTMVTALVASRSPSAIPALVRLLSDPESSIRAIAADALGELRAREATTPLTRVLAADSVPAVRFAAARALLRLGNIGGRSVLDQALASDVPSTRLAALDAESDTPNASWIDTVRDVAMHAPDASTRVRAIELVAPYDLPFARVSAQTIVNGSDTLAARDAGRFLASVAGDLKDLREWLASSDGLTRARAAVRIVNLSQ
jgi:HEAT repeat protein